MFHFLWKWPIVSLDNTLIPRLGPCRALWSCTETAIWTFNSLALIEVHYMEKNPGMFSSKTLIIFFDWRKKDMDIFDYMEVSKLLGNFYSWSELIISSLFLLCKSFYFILQYILYLQHFVLYVTVIYTSITNSLPRIFLVSKLHALSQM